MTRVIGWTEGDGSGHEGYHAEDYFAEDGSYLGPDEHGIEPILEAPILEANTVGRTIIGEGKIIGSVYYAPAGDHANGTVDIVRMSDGTHLAAYRAADGALRHIVNDAPPMELALKCLETGRTIRPWRDSTTRIEPMRTQKQLAGGAR